MIRIDRSPKPWIYLFSIVLLQIISVGNIHAQPPGPTETPERPNIIFILTDDLGWGDLGVFHQNDSAHDKKHRTPNLDALAAGGLQMRAHYCPAPVCAPSRASLLTGVHQGNAIIRDNQFDKQLEDNHTLGTVLQSAGYKTCLIGKYGLQGGDKQNQQTGRPQDWPAYPTKRGFDEFFGYVSHYAGHLHYPNDPWSIANDGHSGTPNLWHSTDNVDEEISSDLSGCYTTDLFTARAKFFIENHCNTTGKEGKPSRQPFFLMLAYDTPHAALQVPSKSYPDGGGQNGGLSWIGDAGNMINTADGKVDSFIHPEYRQPGWSDMEQRFATMVRRIDSSVGDLHQLLVDLQIDDDTLVIFSSDNGPHKESYVANNVQYNPTSFQSYGPYDGIKRDCWEGGIRMPTLASWKNKIVPGGIDQSPSQFHDWMATFCDLAGVPTPARCDGVSLKPTLTGSGQQLPPTTYVEYAQNGRTPNYEDFSDQKRNSQRRQMQVIRSLGNDGIRYKGVRTNIRSANDPFEIYDVEKDPGEVHNLADSSDAFRMLQRGMQSAVLQLRSPNQSSPRPYDNAPIPPISDTRVGSQTELIRYHVAGDWVPQTMGLTPIDRTALPHPESDSAVLAIQTPDTDVFETTMFFEIPVTGSYTISLNCNAAAFVRLHDGHAIDADRGGDVNDRGAVRNLAAGVHPLRMTIRGDGHPITAKLSVRPNP